MIQGCDEEGGGRWGKLTEEITHWKLTGRKKHLVLLMLLSVYPSFVFVVLLSQDRTTYTYYITLLHTVSNHFNSYCVQ